MSFISLVTGSDGNTTNKTPRSNVQNCNNSLGLTLNTNLKGMPAFGSPAPSAAPSFGNPAMSFGSPAQSPNIKSCSSPSAGSPGKSLSYSHQSPRHKYQDSSRTFSPRFHNSLPYTPPIHSNRPPPMYNSQLSGGPGGGMFRTPRPSFTPRGENGGRGGGRNYKRSFQQSPWSEPNNSPGRYMNQGQGFYQPSMVMDPWTNLRPVPVNQCSDGCV